MVRGCYLIVAILLREETRIYRTWRVIIPREIRPLQPFLLILQLLQFEYMFVEVMLQRFVRVVYAELLKRVLFQVFEAEDIEKRYPVSVVESRAVDYGVNSKNQPTE